jgi:hypothetical protein
MASVTNTVINATDIGSNQQSVYFVFTIDNGDILTAGPRVYPVGADLNAAGIAVGQNVIAEKIIQEITQWINSYQSGNLKYATVSQIVQALREAYHNFTQWQLCQLSAVLLAYYQAGTFTAAQFQAAFGISPAQWTTLAAQVSSYNTIYNNAMSASGA